MPTQEEIDLCRAKMRELLSPKSMAELRKMLRDRKLSANPTKEGMIEILVAAMSLPEASPPPPVVVQKPGQSVRVRRLSEP